MKKTVYLNDFVAEFAKYDRADAFSNSGFVTMFNAFEEYEDATNEQIELDVIAICSEYSEYENLEELQEMYSDIETMEQLEERTQVYPIFGGGFIILDF